MVNNQSNQIALERTEDQEPVTVASPFRDVPAEILVEIFQWICPKYDVLSTNGGPWPLRLVCRTWRHIVSGTPSLWSDFILWQPSHTHSRYPCTRCRRLLSFALFFSASHSLSIDCDLAKFTLVHYEQEAAALLLTLMGHCARWKTIRILLDPSGFLFPYFRLLPLRHLSLLESLHVGIDDGYLELDESEISFPIMNFFQVAPRLTDVTLSSLMFEEVQLPLQQLRRLRLDWRWTSHHNNLMPLDCLHFLSDCPSLRVLEAVHAFEVDEDVFEPLYPPVTHQNITVLHASDSSFIGSVALPALRELRILEREDGSRGYCPIDMSEAVIALLQQSRCHLEVFTVQDAAVVEDLFEILRLAPSLRVLDIRYYRCEYLDDDTNDDATMLLKSLSSLDCEALAPALSELSIELNQCGGDSRPLNFARFFRRALPQFVHRRWIDVPDGVSRIQKLRVCCVAEFIVPVSDMADDVLQFKESGLDISITSLP